MSSRDLANPLQSLLSKAAASLPAKSGETSRYRDRLDGATDAVVILADVSSSMQERAGARRKIDLLREALDSVWAAIPDGRLIAFASIPTEVQRPSDLPAPAGSTALDRAIEAAQLLRPRKTIVISDGQPDSEEDSLAAAGKLTGLIEAIYCGPDSDRGAIDFLRRLAAIGGGNVVVCDLVRERSAYRLSLVVRDALGLPAPGGARC